jgi:endonuclease/exonuclease/phosphatase family metal-dependent hydrolase
MSAVIRKGTALESNVDEEDINRLYKTIASEIAFYEEVLAKFKMKYGDLAELEAKLANAELPEHPYWEESIEYRNAYEELENLKKMKGVFEWILKLLMHREYSSGNANTQSSPRT